MSGARRRKQHRLTATAAPVPAPQPAQELRGERPPPPVPPRWHPAGWWAVGGITALFLLAFGVPWQPADAAPIGAFDFSWMLALHDALATGRQFGPEIILPQGPLGFLGNDVYDPRTYWASVAARSAVALAVAWALWRAARTLVPDPLLALPWLIAVAALVGRSADHLFPACALLLMFHYFVVNGRRADRVVYVLAVVLSAASLIKVNQPFHAAAAIGTVTCDRLLQRDRRFFLVPLAYLAGVAVFYLAAGQSPASLGAFVWGWFRVTAGHTDAVGLPGPWVDPAAYLLVAACVTALAGALAWRRWRFAGVLLPLGTAAVLLLLYKHSFMRHDKSHVVMGPLVATAAAVLYLPALSVSGARGLRVGGLATVALAASVLGNLLYVYTPEGVVGTVAAVAQRCAANASAAASHLTEPPRLRREWEAARGGVREAVPLPRGAIVEPVDVYPHRQDVVFAHGLRYAPRPVISSLVATAPVLAGLNARHLRSPAAAPTVLFDVELVDGNYPTMLDGRSLPELLTLYDVADASGGMLVLRRSPAPRAYRFEPLATLAGRFDVPVAIPEPAGAPIWARLRFKRRAAGRVLAMLYKAPTLHVEIGTRGGGGELKQYRLLPTLAEAHGFLLSPLIADRHAYARLASETWATDLAPAAVTTMTVYVADGSQETSFDPDFEVELQRLEFDR